MSYRFDTSLVSGAYVFGDTGLGVKASSIPSSGDSGPGYAYSSLNLPADNDLEIIGEILSTTTNGKLVAYEDTSFEYTPYSDGPDSFTWRLKVDGVVVGSPVIVSIYSGSNPITVVCSTGSAVATGHAATISEAINLACNLAIAVADGIQAGVVQATVIESNNGIANAVGFNASVTSESLITCQTALALSANLQAIVSQEIIVSCNPATANAIGFQGQLVQHENIVCQVGSCDANGYTATITVGSETLIVCNEGLATAQGLQSNIVSELILNCNLGISNAIGSTCQVLNDSETVITCGSGIATSLGYSATVISGNITLTDADLSAIADKVYAKLISEQFAENLIVALLNASHANPIHANSVEGAWPSALDNANATWLHSFTSKLLTVPKFLGLK